MSDPNDKLRQHINRAYRRAAGGEPPSFEGVWGSARRIHAASRRRYRWFAGAAATVAAVVIGVHLQAPTDQPTYIEISELLGSTSWSAPSDVLLPEREFDIYQDMPVLFESTEPAEGALL